MTNMEQMDYKNPRAVRINQIYIIKEYLCDVEVHSSKSTLMDRSSGATKIQ